MKKKLSNIVVHMHTDTIKDHRYKSIDDWQNPYINSNNVVFTVQAADTGNWKYNMLIFFHALVEQVLCYSNKITDEQVSEWDMRHTHCDDPGSHEEAPYFREHKSAEEIEAMISTYLDIPWDDYGKAIDKVLAKYPKKKL